MTHAWLARRLAAVVAAWFCAGSMALAAAPRRATLQIDTAGAPVRFAAAEVSAALRARGYQIVEDSAGSLNVHFWPMDAAHLELYAEMPYRSPGDVRAEGFSLRVLKNALRPQAQPEFVVLSRDAAGAMYGGLELAEQIRTRGVDRVADTDRNPHMAMRGTKFNIPLDLRTPSYSDMSDAAQANIDTVWDFEFWRRYLDELARDRYNFVSLWNLHPFPSMVRVPEYPEVALDDVWRSKIRFEEDYSTRTNDIVTPAMLANKEVLRKLGIDQKIEFWRRVMQYATDRNIDFYIVTWNIYTYGVDGKYGITDAIDNPKTRDYFRASVREMFHTYPLLAGIGLTTGENMGEISGPAAFQAKEDWVFSTYGQGVLDAAQAEPARKFRLIHRQHETRAQDIAATFQPVIAQPNVDFVFSFKYAQAHALSSTTQTFHREFLESLGPHKTLWTLRNDDALLLRWAAPDFVREFLGNIPPEKTQGFYLGSDMWVWGRDFLSKAPGPRGQLEVEKHWLHFLLWGRLGFDPGLDDARVAELIGLRFPGVNGAKLLAAWQDASMIYPLVTGFHWADFDFQWYIEACRSRPGPARTESGFHSVETFITQKAHPGTNNLTIPEYVAGKANGVTPPQVADAIDAHADAALAALWEFKAPRSGEAELTATLNDVSSMARLGKYYAAKIRGATELAMFRATKNPQHQQLAVEHLEQAAGFWRAYMRRVSDAYGPRVWTNRVGYVDWEELSREVQRDVEIARAPAP